MRPIPRELTAAQIGVVALRRLVRKSKQALGLGGRRPDPLPTEAGPRFLVEPPHLSTAARRVVELYPDRAAQSMAEAQAILNGTVEVFGRAVRLPRGERWHQDPLSGAPWPADTVGPEELLRPGRDARAVWELGRLGHLVTLGRARCLADLGGAAAVPGFGAACARGVAEGMEDFARANPPGVGVHWAAAMEAGLRVVNLGLAFQLVRGHPALPRDFERRVLELAHAHAAFIRAHREDLTACPNNHLVANDLGLLAAGVLLGECAAGRALRREAVEGLERELARQVRPDGGSFEASLGYHRLSLEMFLAAWVLAERAGPPFPPSAARTLQTMAWFVRRVEWPDGTLPQVGDEDASRALPLGRRGPLELRYLRSLAAAVLGAPELAPPGPPCEEAIWLGSDVAGAPPRAGGSAATKVGGAAPDVLSESGLCVLRAEDAQVLFRFGNAGQCGRGGHAHNDRLSVQLWAGGRLVIADPGTLVYAADPDARDALRSTRAHATVSVDGEEQTPLPRGRLFALPGPAARLLLADARERGQVAVGELLTGGARPWRHRREVRLQTNGTLLVIDLVDGKGVRLVEARFPLPDAQASLRPATTAEEKILAALGLDFGAGWCAARVAALGPAEGPHALLAVAPPPASWRLDLAPAVYSPGYGRARAALSVRLCARGALPLVLRTVIVPLRASATKER